MIKLHVKETHHLHFESSNCDTSYNNILLFQVLYIMCKSKDLFKIQASETPLFSRYVKFFHVQT